MRLTRVFATSAVLIFAGAVAPIAANASPVGRFLHLHPRVAQSQDCRIQVQLYNNGHGFQDVKVDGRTYTVLPHDSLLIKAPAGTTVYAASTGLNHRKGDVLFAIAPKLQGTTVSLQ